MNDTGEHTWYPPQYDVSTDPSLMSSFMNFPSDSDFPENFARTAKWCSDGSSILAQCENRTFQFLDLPPDLLDLSIQSAEQNIVPQYFPRSVHQPSAILDFIWYPSASSKDAASFCFIASVRDCPVKLLDATDGRLRASYPIVDHRERQIAPHSLAFNLTANKLYCGFEDAIEIFDIHRPGEGIRLFTTPSKKSKEGLRGIISALAFSPSYDFYAAGSLSSPSSYSTNIAMFSESEGTKPLMFVGTGESSVRTGVTQLHFNPMKPHMLYAAFRRLDTIYSWDLRGDASKPLKVFYNETEGEKKKPHSEITNQKLRFDVDLGGQLLVTGDRKGAISLFELDSVEGAEMEVDAAYSENVPKLRPALKFRAHDDAIGSVAFHPLQRALLSVSGSRHFGSEERSQSQINLGSPDSSSSSSESSEEEDEELASEGPKSAKGIVRNKRRAQPYPLDASVKLWSWGSKTP